MAEVVRANLPPANAPRPRLVARILAERPATAFKVLAHRLRKALLSEDRAEIKKAASAMTSEERYAALEQFEQDDIRKGEVEDLRRGFWTGHDYSGTEPRGVWSKTHPRPEQGGGAARPADPSRAATAGPAIAPQTETGFLRALRIGYIVHFHLDGERHHGKILAWGKLGARVVTADGSVAAVRFEDMKHGVHESSKAEHEERKARREWAKSAAMRELLSDAPVEQRARIGKAMGLDLS